MSSQGGAEPFERECMICYEQFKSKGKRVPHMLPCGHIFCASCLNQGWGTQKGTGRVECSSCRQTFRPDPQFAPYGVVSKAADGFAKAFRLLNWLGPEAEGAIEAEKGCDEPINRHQLVHKSLQTIKARCKLEDWAACDIAKELAALRQQATQPPSSALRSFPHQAGRQASAAAACWQPRQATLVQGNVPQQCATFPKAAAAAAALPRPTRGENVKKDVAADIPLFVRLLSHGSVQVQVETAGLLGDLASGFKQHKAAISQAGGVQALLRLSEEGSSSAARGSALAALGCLCRGCPGHQAEVEKVTLSLLGNLRSHHGILQEESALLLQRMCAGSGERRAALRANHDVVDALVHLLERQSDSRAATPAAAAAVRCLHTLAQDKQDKLFRARLCQPPGNVINSLADLLGDGTLPEIQADSIKLLRRLSFDSQPTRVAIAAAARPALERLSENLDAADKLLNKLPS